MKHLALLVLLLAALAMVRAHGTTRPDPPDPTTQSLPRILLLGDSISMGYHQFVVAALEGEAIVVRPKENCAGTTKGIQKIDQWLQIDGGGFDVIHFNFGLHDLKRVKSDTGRNSNDPADPRQADLPTYERNLRTIVEKLEATGATLIFATTTPVPPGVRPHRDPEDAERYNAAAKRIMAEHGIAIDDLYAFASMRLAEIQKPADVHFSKEGSRQLAGEVTRHLRKALGQKLTDAGVQSTPPASPKTLLPPTPEGWRYERIDLPPEFAPNLESRGFEELRFAPGMFDPDADSYFSYVFALGLEGDVDVDATFLESFLLDYYHGLCESVAGSRGLDLDLSKIAVDVEERGERLEATVDMFDAFGTGAPLRLRLEVFSASSPGLTKVLAIASPKPTGAPVWTTLHGMAAAWRSMHATDAPGR
jgi:acyl-CoA thioesterase-1